MSVFTGVSAALSGAGRREAEDFARMLESGQIPADHDLADLVALARRLAPVEHAPPAEFRSALRERLVAEASTRPTTLPTPRTADPSDPPRRVGWRHAVATVALASVVAGTGAAAASSRALPGDVLYGLKRQIESVQLALARSDLERGRELLEQADSRLGEAERLAAGGDATDPASQREVAMALDEMRDATEAGAAALTDSYEETGDAEPMLLLERFVADQQRRLEDLYDLLGPALRARVAALVDELGRLGASAGAVVASTAAGAADEPGRAVADGWAMSRLADRATSEAGTVVGGVTGDSGLAGQLDETSGGSAGGDDGAGGLLGDVVDGVTGGSTSGGSASDGDRKQPLPDVTSPLPDVTSPLPDVTEPLPDVTEPLPDVTEPLPDLTEPLPTVSACVPVPPLTSC